MSNVKTVQLERSTFRDHVTRERGMGMYAREQQMFAEVPKIMEEMARELESMGYEMSNHEIEYSPRNYVKIVVHGRKEI